jgi:hypothetical protein
MVRADKSGRGGVQCSLGNTDPSRRPPIIRTRADTRQMVRLVAVKRRGRDGTTSRCREQDPVSGGFVARTSLLLREVFRFS